MLGLARSGCCGAQHASLQGIDGAKYMVTGRSPPSDQLDLLDTSPRQSDRVPAAKRGYDEAQSGCADTLVFSLTTYQPVADVRTQGLPEYLQPHVRERTHMHPNDGPEGRVSNFIVTIALRRRTSQSRFSGAAVRPDRALGVLVTSGRTTSRSRTPGICQSGLMERRTDPTSTTDTTMWVCSYRPKIIYHFY
jgi:hypothetical protein